MNTPLHLLTRRALWLAALLASAAVQTAPADDVKQADVALRAGDLPTAMALLRKAADQDFPPAQARLGDLLRAAEFEAEAVVLYQKAADKGDPAGEVGLGRAYADGVGVKKDAAKALELYRKAEAKQYGPAYDQLARAYATGTLGVAKDPQQARAYEEKFRAWQKLNTAGAK